MFSNFFISSASFIFFITSRIGLIIDHAASSFSASVFLFVCCLFLFVHSSVLIIPFPIWGMGSCCCTSSSSLLLSHSPIGEWDFVLVWFHLPYYYYPMHSPYRGMGFCSCVVSSSLLLLSHSPYRGMGYCSCNRRHFVVRQFAHL